MRRNTIDMLLIRGGVETNPGPVVINSGKPAKINLSIRSFNCNGLGNVDKFRRLLVKARNEVKKGGFVLLQETHIKDENIIKLYWNMNYVSSCISTQSAGVMILFDETYECLETFRDAGGRMAIAVVKNNLEKLIIVNIYAPCDPVLAIEFMGLVYNKVYEIIGLWFPPKPRRSQARDYWEETLFKWILTITI